MTSNDVFKIFKDWKDNEFQHFKARIERKVDWIFATIILALIGIIVNLFLYLR